MGGAKLIAHELYIASTVIMSTEREPLIPDGGLRPSRQSRKVTGPGDGSPTVVSINPGVGPGGEVEQNGGRKPGDVRSLKPDDILNFIGFGRFQVVAYLLAGLTYFSYGSEVSFFIFMGKKLEDIWGLSSIEYAVLPAATAIPNLIGAFAFSYLSDQYGRVWPYALTLTICGVFAVGSAFAPSYPVMITLRVLASVGVGGIPVLTFPTLVEFLPVKNRAKAAVLVLLPPSFGLCAASGLAWWLIPSYPSWGWRYLTIVISFPSLFIVVFRLVFYFQSPRYLIVKGKTEQAWKVFSKMAEVNGKDLRTFLTEEEFLETFALKGVENKAQSFFQLVAQLLKLFKGVYRRRTLCLIVIYMTEACGYLGSTLFLPQFLSDLHVNTYFSIFVAFVAQFPGILLMSIIIEWPEVGRLNSLRIYALLASIFYIVLAFVQTTISVPVLLVFIYFCMVPNLSLIYIYISESYPTNIRALTTAFFYSIQALCALVFPFLGGFLVKLRTHWIYPLVWGCIFAVQFLAALVLNYEPYGKKLVDTFE